MWLRKSLHHLRGFGLPSSVLEAAGHVLLTSSSEGNPARFVAAAAEAAGLDAEEVERRAVAAFLLSASINVMDDVMDGDAVYLRRPHVDGPPIQYLLHAAGWTAVPDAPRRATELIAGVAAYQFVEANTQTWTPEHYREVVERFAGRQAEAYFNLAWFGTDWEPLAMDLGHAFANPILVYGDARDRSERRYWSMDGASRSSVRDWVDQLLDRLDSMLLERPPLSFLRPYQNSALRDRAETLRLEGNNAEKISGGASDAIPSL